MALCTYNHRGELQIDVSDVPRCPSPEAKSNYLRSRSGSMKRIMAWSADESELDYTIPPRIKPEAKDNYEPHKGGRMNRLLSEHLTSSRKSARDGAVPRIRLEAEDNAALDRGKRMEALMSKHAQPLTTSRRTYRRTKSDGLTSSRTDRDELYTQQLLSMSYTVGTPKLGDTKTRIKDLAHNTRKAINSPPPVPRVKTEGEPNYTLDKGRRMDRLMHNHGLLSPSPRPAPRVKPEAEEAAALDRGKRMERLINEYLLHPSSPRPAPRIKPEAAANATYGKNGLAHILMNYYGRLKESPRPVPRLKTEAKNTAYRARGSMKKHFTEMGQKQCIHVPGAQTKKYSRTMTV